MKSRIVIFLVLWVFLLGSCTEMVPLLSNQESELLVSFTNVPLKQANPGTKAIDATVDEGLANGYVVSDFWLFQYNEKGALIGKPRYYRTGGNAEINVSILKPTAEGVIYKAVFVANVHDNSFDTKIDYSTISALKAAGKVVASSSDLYQLGYNDLIMSGVVDITSATTEIASCPLYRNVAKLNVNISNAAASGLKITSIQLKNVNNRLYYADCLYSNDDGAESFVNFELDEVNLDEGQNKTLTYYLTRNMRGTSDEVTSQKDKNQYAPPYSTYFEIIAEHIVRGTSVRYRFYLGKNSTTDFNLEPNYAYTFNLTFKNMGSNDDLRVEDLGEVKLEDANSYIVHPTQSNKGAKFIVPVKDRVNKFWNNEIGKVDPGASMDSYTEHIIGDDTEWVAEVIWQDIAGEQLIKFCMPDGSLTDTYTATGGESFSFVLTDRAITLGVKGNLLIGVRNAKQSWTVSDGYMWSWHIWLTDYDPDENVGQWAENTYAYQVPGGYVHNYPSFKDIPKYQGKFIMDRNIGATRHESKLNITVPEVRQASGMYYAYGRKDPFPPGDVYNIRGEKINLFQVDQGPGTIHASVRRPYAYYKRGSDTAGNDWSSDVSLRSYDWNDLNKVAKNGDNKSFFDPCPPGWHIPHSSILTCYGAPKSGPKPGTYVYAANIDVRDWTSTDGNQFGEWGGWVIHLSGKEGYDKQTEQGGTWQYSPTNFAYFPASDMRAHGTGELGKSIMTGGLWLTNPETGGNAGYLYFSNNLNKETDGLLFSFPRAFYRYLGFPVRCIKM